MSTLRTTMRKLPSIMKADTTKKRPTTPIPRAGMQFMLGIIPRKQEKLTRKITDISSGRSPGSLDEFACSVSALVSKTDGRNGWTPLGSRGNLRTIAR